MGRYFIRLSYRGTSYNGWQSQSAEGSVTVQQTIEKALSSLLREEVGLTGCGRTDSGVHARDYYAHFDTTKKPDPGQWTYKLNRILPEDIAIHSVIGVHDEAHARFDAVSRSYEYHLHTTKSPFRHESWHYPYGNPDRQLLNQAAALILEYHDFATFCKTRSGVRTTICLVSESIWKQQDDSYVYRISADRFLRGMIRLIVGMCLNYAKGSISEADIRAALQVGSRTGRDWSVPAVGLMLCDIRYPYLDSEGNYTGKLA